MKKLLIKDEYTVVLKDLDTNETIDTFNNSLPKEKSEIPGQISLFTKEVDEMP